MAWVLETKWLVSPWDAKQTWNYFPKYQGSWVSPNWTCLYFSETKISFDPNLNPWDSSLGADGLFTLGTWCSCLSQGLRPPNQAPEKGPRRRRYILGRVNFLQERALLPLQPFSLRNTALRAPEGASVALTSHTLFFQMNLNLFLSKSLQKKKKKSNHSAVFLLLCK